MRPFSVTVGSQTSSIALPVNWRQKPFSVGIGCVVSPGANLEYTVQHTFDDIFDPTVTPTWMNHETIVNAVSTQDGNYAFPCRAVRLTVGSWTSGDVTMTFIQGE
jgi:hypothetical protein